MKVLIIGGGIAGSTLAYALHQLRKDYIVVADARPDDGDTEGAFLTLAPNGVNALKSIGLGDVPTVAGGFDLSGLDFHNARGRRIAELRGENDLRDYGARSVVLRRARLQAALAERARQQGTTHLFSARLVELQPHGDMLRAIFDDGRTQDADVVIGADGIWSTVRRLTWPDASKPAYTGIVDCGGWANVDLPDTSRQQMHFGHRAFFGYAIKDSLAYWFSNVSRNDEPARSELDSLDQNVWMSTIRQLHAGDSSPIPEVLESADSSVGAWPIYDMPDLERWNTSNVCLIGDAAHAVSPSSGQGASLAIEDAIVLARCLSQHPNSTEAFAAFVHERKARAEKIVRFGRQIGAHKISSTVGSVFRDLTLGFFLRMGARNTKEQYAYRVPDLSDTSLEWEVRSA